MIEISANGLAYDRGRAQQGAAPVETVRRATVARVEQARADGLIDADAAGYLAAQRRFHETHDPESLQELRGVADAFGLAEADMLAHLHLGTLRDMKGGAALIDGCSAIAVGQGPEGPLVFKNRDFSGAHLGIQCVMRHSGPDIATGQVLSLGSLGSLAAWSSGVNAAGLAVADTQVAVNRHRVGWLRYFLLPRLLARASTVAEALAMIRALPHAGGGTLVLADRSGATASVELSARGPAIAEGGLQWRTNHYTDPATRDETLGADGDRIAGNSHARLDHLARVLPGHDWTCARARALMATHPGPDGAPICQHGDGAEGAETISSVVYSCSLGEMEISEGTPCLGRWQRMTPCR
jgi:predicted choloylglycine hydrolase